MYKRNLKQVFSNLTTILKLYITLPITSSEDERNFSISNKKNWSTMLQESLNCLSVLSTEDDVSKRSWEEVTEEYGAKKCIK
jgi:hypothetical protein